MPQFSIETLFLQTGVWGLLHRALHLLTDPRHAAWETRRDPMHPTHRRFQVRDLGTPRSTARLRLLFRFN